MNVLVVAHYPYSAYKFFGTFNERSVRVLKEHCRHVAVLSPRPYVPAWLSGPLLRPRWRAYATIEAREVRHGIPVYRPGYLQIPGAGSAAWISTSAFLSSRRLVRRLHQRYAFDVILGFDLLRGGALAWRLARDLRLPVAGWATGERIPLSTLTRLDLVFYQSRALLEEAATVLGVPVHSLPEHNHLVLPRGVPNPPTSASGSETRDRVRSLWGATPDSVVVINVGRVAREKGIFELLDAMRLVVSRNPKAMAVIIGSIPQFDDTADLLQRLHQAPELRDRVRLLPACSGDEVWEYLCGGDIFAFPSHHEGMPNALLEAMALGLPAVAFAIPSVREIEAGTGAPILVPLLDSSRFAEAILRLSASPDDRARIGGIGRAQVMRRFSMESNMAEAVRRLEHLASRKPDQYISTRA